MNTLIISLSIIFTTVLLHSQSNFVTDIGTVLDIGTLTDICADVITINGTLTGNGTFCNAPVPVENESDSGTPKEFSLAQNYPNPFNPSTSIKYSIIIRQFVVLKVFDILGKEIATLVNEEKAVGTYELSWNAAILPSGVYFYKIQAGDFVQTRKMILLR
jgi:hypothetical protein